MGNFKLQGSRLVPPPNSLGPSKYRLLDEHVIVYCSHAYIALVRVSLLSPRGSCISHAILVVGPQGRSMAHAWYDISCREVCEHVEKCLGTPMYEDKLVDAEVSGQNLFQLSSQDDWSFFYSCVGIKSFQHMMKLAKWVGQCKENSCIGFDFKSAVVSNLPIATETVKLELSSIENVRSSATSLPASKFYPTPDEIFRMGGKDILADYGREACTVHNANFRVVRSWFAAWKTDQVIYAYMNENFKKNTQVKEQCRAYMKSKMAELSPLPFECPITHAKHHIPSPEYWVFDVIKRRKHEFKKQDKKTGKVLFPRCFLIYPVFF